MSEEATDVLIDHIKATDERKQKAEIAGLIREPVEDDGITKACENCIYFLPRAGWCDLPELDFPVDADWWCKLWRV